MESVSRNSLGEIQQTWSVTNVDTNVFSHTWRIENFVAYKSYGEFHLESTKLHNAKGDTFWFIISAHNNNVVPEQQTLKFYMGLTAANQEAISVRVDLSMVLPDNSKRLLKICRVSGCTGNKKVKMCKYKKDSFFEPPWVFPNGDAIFVFDLTTISDASAHQVKHKVCHASRGIMAFSKDLEKLYESGRFSDCTIRCEDRDFRVHKAVLATRSNVFSTMFDASNSFNGKSSIVSIDGVDPEIMQDVIKWAYTGNVDEIVSKAERLIPVAERFQLELLKSLCEHALTIIVDVHNACRLLVLADKYRVEGLKDFVVRYIKRHFHQVKSTSGFINDVLNCQEYMTLIFNSFEDVMMVDDTETSSDGKMLQITQHRRLKFSDESSGSEAEN